MITALLIMMGLVVLIFLGNVVYCSIERWKDR